MPMSDEQSAFSKNTINAVAAEPGKGILDELNLPPKITAFIRGNARILQVVFVATIILIVCWSLYGRYVENKRQVAAGELAVALQQPDAAAQRQALSRVETEYSGTQAATWSRLESAHLDYAAGAYDQALSKYQAVLNDLDDDNPLFPLVQFSLAVSNEMLEKFDEAIALYLPLTKLDGFSVEAYPALGLLYEKTNQPDKAREAYEKFLEIAKDEPLLKERAEMIGDRLGRLQPGA